MKNRTKYSRIPVGREPRTFGSTSDICGELFGNTQINNTIQRLRCGNRVRVQVVHTNIHTSRCARSLARSLVNNYERVFFSPNPQPPSGQASTVDCKRAPGAKTNKPHCWIQQRKTNATRLPHRRFFQPRANKAHAQRARVNICVPVLGCCMFWTGSVRACGFSEHGFVIDYALEPPRACGASENELWPCV